jgi:hypothetical protein
MLKQGNFQNNLFKEASLRTPFAQEEIHPIHD